MEWMAQSCPELTCAPRFIVLLPWPQLTLSSVKLLWLVSRTSGSAVARLRKPLKCFAPSRIRGILCSPGGHTVEESVAASFVLGAHLVVRLKQTTPQI